MVDRPALHLPVTFVKIQFRCHNWIRQIRSYKHIQIVNTFIRGFLTKTHTNIKDRTGDGVLYLTFFKLIQVRKENNILIFINELLYSEKCDGRRALLMGYKI